VITLPACALGPPSAGGQISSPAGWSAAKRARLKAASRQRRVIFNDDAEDLAYPSGGTVEGFLASRLRPLIGTHVDTISWNVTYGDAPVYDSKAQPIGGEAQGPVTQPGYSRNVAPNLKKLIDAGHCPFRLVVDFAHENGMECFVCLRMNDCHDSFMVGWKTLWKQQHPEWLVDSEGIPPDRFKHRFGLYVSAQDFTHQAVRDRKFEIAEELAARYDMEGIELNFMRHPVFFSRTMRGLPVTAGEREIMTSLMRRIRRCTDAAAARRGRPLLIAAVVPDDLAKAMNIGLDVKTWVQQDLVDILIPGLGYAPFSVPVAEFVKLARPCGVLVYPCINRVAPWKVSEELLTEGFFGVATNWYRAGANGIFFWNLATPFLHLSGEKLMDTRRKYYACLTDIGDPAALVGKDKLFCADDPVVRDYAHATSAPPLPVALRADKAQRVPLNVGDDLAAAGKAGAIAELQLTLSFKGPVDADTLLLRLNGRRLTGGELIAVDANKSEYEMTHMPDASAFRWGSNSIEASIAEEAGPARPVVFQGARLLVRYGSG
jgi:hypothetical protein